MTGLWIPLKKVAFYLIPSTVFWSSFSTGDLLIAASDKIARAFNRCGVYQTMKFDMTKAWYRVSNAGLLHKLKSCEIPGQVFELRLFLSNKGRRLILDGKCHLSGLWNTISRMRLVNFTAGQTQLVVLLIWEWKIGAPTLSLLLKLLPRTLEPRFIRRNFFLLRLFLIPSNLPYGLALNTVVMSGQVLLIATWISWISYRNGCIGLLVLHLQLLLNPWFVVETKPAWTD